MKKLALGALFIGGLVACGGGKDVQLIDAPNDGNVAACNPVAQTGCAANEKCTWFIDQKADETLTPPRQEVGHIGAEIYLVISAIAGGFRLAQSFVGTKSRVMDHSSGDLVFAMRQTVGVLFWSLEQYFPLWSAQTESQPIPTIGAEHEISLEPVPVIPKRLHEMFVRGVAEIEPVLKSILSAQTLGELQRAAAVPEGSFQYSDELWVRTAYEFAASYHKAVISRDHIIQALAPLYRGKAYAFLEQNRDTTPAEMESNVEALCQTFERSKPYLLELWNGKK